MVDWSRGFDLLANRIKICNQLLGCRYGHALDNPMRLVGRDGAYDLLYDGEVLVSFGVWDMDALHDAIVVADSWSDCLWRTARVAVSA